MSLEKKSILATGVQAGTRSEEETYALPYALCIVF